MMYRCSDLQSSVLVRPEVVVEAGAVNLLICVVHAIRSAKHHAAIQVVAKICVVIAFISDGANCFIVLNPKSYVPGLVVSPAVVELVNCCSVNVVVRVDCGSSHVWCGVGGIGDSGALDPSSWA